MSDDDFADEPCPDCLGTGKRRIGYDVATVQRWMALNVWMALGRDSQEFERAMDGVAWADMWAGLCSDVRLLADFHSAGPGGSGD